MIDVLDYDDSAHRQDVVDLWTQLFDYSAGYRVPGTAIDKKLEHNDGLFWVALDDGKLVGTAMAGYDGHRGWIYSVAVAPDCQRKGVGTIMLNRVQEILTELGCMKINLQILPGNEKAISFYEANGWAVEKLICMGKKLI